MTDIATDKGGRAFADSKLDLAIPLSQCAELRETMKKINEISTELARLVDRANHIYTHCYITISADSSDDATF